MDPGAVPFFSVKSRVQAMSDASSRLDHVQLDY